MLAAAGRPVDSLRVGRAAWVVVVSARDGFVVTFSAAELDPRLGSTRALLALAEENAPLPPAEAPFRLIVLSDRRAARSAHQVERIRVIDAIAR